VFEKFDWSVNREIVYGVPDIFWLSQLRRSEIFIAKITINMASSVRSDIFARTWNQLGEHHVSMPLLSELIPIFIAVSITR
jgi:hypothetical protein